jgi:hypothetical protein
MGSLTSRLARPRFKQVVVLAGALAMFGCGDGGSAPGVTAPPSTATGTPESRAGKGPTEVTRKGRISTKGMDPAGSR